MSTLTKNQNHHPCFSIGDVATAVADHGTATNDSFSETAEHWHELTTDHPGTRLFRSERRGATPMCWLAEVTAGERTYRRRCASELYARWWLHAFVEPVRSPDPMLRARLDEPRGDEMVN